MTLQHLIHEWVPDRMMVSVRSASTSVAAQCADDPNECTLKKLCEVATTIDRATPFDPPVIRVEVKA